MATKICNKCNITKDTSDFYKDIKSTDGIKHACKFCGSIQDKIWRSANKEKFITSRRTADKTWRQTLSGKYSQYKRGAKERNIEFHLSKNEFITFWNNPCFYCNKNITTIGIDRVDSKLGYSISNCVSCCTTCNMMKLDKSEKEFYESMIAILRHKNIEWLLP